jgi:hypothetical protein
MLKLKHLLASFLILFSVSSWGQQASSAPVQNNSQTTLPKFLNIAGFTCSFYKSHFDLFSFSFVLSVYSTYKVENSCDAKYFYDITLASMDAQSNTFTQSHLTLRGSAHGYTMDVNLSPVTSKFFYVGKLRFSKTGEVRFSLIDGLRNNSWKVANVVNSSYREFSFNSQLHYIWNIGTLAHHLIAPNGDRFIMYTFTNQIATDLTRDNLINLGSRLNLPDGWSYENSLLTKTVTVYPTPATNFRSTVIFDDFNNFYVKHD